MRILVTGGAGFIGSHLVEALIAAKYEVAVLDNLSTGRREYLDVKVRLYEGDLQKREFVFNVLAQEKPEVVFHLAAQASVSASVRDPVKDALTNVMGTLHLLEAMVAAGSRKIVYSSTAAVYGAPRVLPIPEDHPVDFLSPYATSKFGAEQYVRVYFQMHQLDYTILRYANVYGPRQATGPDGGVVANFLRQLFAGENVVIFGDGEQTRDFIYVKDVVAANLKALTQAGAATLNIASGNACSVNQLLNSLREITGRKVTVVRQSERREDIRESVLETGSARQRLGWEVQYTLRDGLEATVLEQTFT